MTRMRRYGRETRHTQSTSVVYVHYGEICGTTMQLIFTTQEKDKRSLAYVIIFSKRCTLSSLQTKVFWRGSYGSYAFIYILFEP